MGKSSKKTFVYLDQIFVSNIAKSGSNPRVDPAYGELFELLHEGHTEEKLFVPKSIFHDMETSMVTHLKEPIFRRLHQMGQVQLQHYDTIARFQIHEAAEKFIEQEPRSASHSFVFHDEPDKRVKMFDIHIDMRFEELFDLRSMRSRTAEQLKQARAQVLAQRRTFEEQYKAELEAARQQTLKEGPSATGYLIRDPLELEQFVRSTYFSEIPTIDISSRMWASILTDRFGESPVREGHSDDIQIISTFLPYADIFTADSFMAQLLERLGIPSKYNTTVFSSSKEGVQKFKEHLIEMLPSAPIVNTPIVSVFVLADEAIKEHSFEFFKELGLQAMSVEHRRGWVDVFAFDDGKMPSYSDPRVKTKIPFSGLQEIEHICITLPKSTEDVLAVCCSHCRSDNFLFIDHYRKLPENFLATLIQYTSEGRDRILDYKVITCFDGRKSQ